MIKRVVLMLWVMLVFLFITLAYFYKTISVNYKQNVEMVAVTIKGQVMASGTYYVEQGSPIALVLNQSGGLTANGVLPEDFDFSMPVYEDMTITISRAYTFDRY